VGASDLDATLRKQPGGFLVRTLESVSTSIEILQIVAPSVAELRQKKKRPESPHKNRWNFQA
jgi:hypothetical protein